MCEVCYNSSQNCRNTSTIIYYSPNGFSLVFRYRHVRNMSVNKTLPSTRTFPATGNGTAEVAPKSEHELYIVIYFCCATLFLGVIFFFALRKSIKLCFFSTFYGHKDAKKNDGPGMKTVYDIDLQKLQKSFTRFKSDKQGLATDAWLKRYGSSGTLSTMVSMEGSSRYGSSNLSVSTIPTTDTVARRTRKEKVELLRSLWKGRRKGSVVPLPATSMFRKNNGSETSSYLSRVERQRKMVESDSDQEVVDDSILGSEVGVGSRSDRSGRSSPVASSSVYDANIIGGLHEPSFSEGSIASVSVGGAFIESARATGDSTPTVSGGSTNNGPNIDSVHDYDETDGPNGSEEGDDHYVDIVKEGDDHYVDLVKEDDGHYVDLVKGDDNDEDEE